MKKLVFVHGMNQQGKDPHKLKSEWEDALSSAWKRQGIVRPICHCVMPFYGDVLDKLTREVRGSNPDVSTMGGVSGGTFDETETKLLFALKQSAGVSDDDIRRELGKDVIERGPLNWEWVQGIGRALSRKVPWLGEACLPFVRQVSAYLSRPHIRHAVDELVYPTLDGATVVVAHSLGTVISYSLLRSRPLGTQAPLYVTLGSPLGIDVIKSYMRPPALGVPECVDRWVNVADERDYVALVSRLDRESFCDGIANVTDVANRRSDPHYIGDYLSNDRVSTEIARSLS